MDVPSFLPVARSSLCVPRAATLGKLSLGEPRWVSGAPRRVTAAKETPEGGIGPVSLAPPTGGRPNPPPGSSGYSAVAPGAPLGSSGCPWAVRELRQARPPLPLRALLPAPRSRQSTRVSAGHPELTFHRCDHKIHPLRRGAESAGRADRPTPEPPLAAAARATAAAAAAARPPRAIPSHKRLHVTG